MLPTFSQNLTLQEEFETVAQKELKVMEFDGAFCKKEQWPSALPLFISLLSAHIDA